MGAPGGAAEGPLDGVAQNALGEASIEPLEALGRGVVDGQDEAEVDRVPQTPAVLAEGLADRRLVAPEGAIPPADP